MKWAHFWSCFLTGTAFLIMASFAEAQFPGGGGQGGFQGKGRGGFGGFQGKGGGQGGFQGKGGFGRGGGGGGFDPSKIFDFMAKGQDFVLISDMRMGKEQAEEWAKKNGITDGKLTRDSFTKYMNERMEQMKNGGGGFGGRGGPGGGGSPNESPQDKEARIKSQAEDYFKRQDTNKDGYLTENEMSRGLQANYKEYDKNRDGKIDQGEATEYIRAFSEGRIGRNRPQDNNQNKNNPSNPAVTNIIIESDTQRPVIFRAGKLPSSLPEWFKSLDGDVDGQVGLYEWRQSNKSIEEFNGMDRNGDGFLTAEEVIRYDMIARGEPPTLSSPGQETNNNGGGKGGPGGFGRGGQNGFGRGGPGGFGRGGFGAPNGNTEIGSTPPTDGNNRFGNFRGKGGKGGKSGRSRGG